MGLKLFGRLRGRDALAFLKHRRWWEYYRDVPGPSVARLEEDGTTREQEDGTIRITEGF